MEWIELYQSDWIEAVAHKPETRGAEVPDEIIGAFLEGDARVDVASRMSSVPIEWRLDICLLELSLIVE